MKKKTEISVGEQLKYYEDKLALRVKKENLLEKQEKALEREECFGAFWHAKRVFSFPFKGGAFAALWTAILALGATLIFSGCAFFVTWAVAFCAIVDLIYAILYGLGYPFIVAYFAIFKKKRIKRLKAKINKTTMSLSQMTPKSELKQKIRELNKNNTTERNSYTGSTYSTSGITNTEYYKNKKEEYFRQYMGYPPKDEDSGLSSLSTDTTLDLHPGDY